VANRGRTDIRYQVIQGSSDQFSDPLAYGLPGNQDALLQA
jgi:hypothetical protein